MKTALIMLAAGLSSRFGGDKLLAPLKSKPLALYAASLWEDRSDVYRLAIVPYGAHKRRALFEAKGWTVMDNDAPARGQSSSLAIGVRAAGVLGCDSIIISLADMPFVQDVHLDTLTTALHKADAVMSLSDETLLPPAAFTSTAFSQLQEIKGDRGARSVFQSLERTATVGLDPSAARDIDTLETLTAINFERPDHA